MTPIDQLFAFLRFPSISTDPAFADDVKACAGWLVDKLTSLGLDTKLHATDGHPIVTARSACVEGKPTVLIYGHYDVQPVDPIELWKSEPFEPEVREGKIWGRGTSDDKGQLLTHVLGVESLLKEDKELPVNLIFLFEGEEEVGSTHLAEFLREHKEELACDIIVVSDTGMVAEGVPTLSYGLRGITAGELIVRGPGADLHSGLFGGAVANPLTAMCELISSFHNEKGEVMVEGFYEDVRPLEAWERRMWSTVPGYADTEIKQVTGSPDVYGEEGYTTAERIWARPTFELNGLYGGYQGPGSKTVLPTHAVCKISCRLVPDQDPKDIQKKIVAHCRKHVPKGVTVEFVPGHSGNSYITDPNSSYGKAAQEALEEVFKRPPVLIREGGSIPIVNDFKEILGADTLLLGLALPDSGAHSPNENFPVSHFEAGIELSKALLRRLGC